MSKLGNLIDGFLLKHEEYIRGYHVPTDLQQQDYLKQKKRDTLGQDAKNQTSTQMGLSLEEKSCKPGFHEHHSLECHRVDTWHKDKNIRHANVRRLPQSVGEAHRKYVLEHPEMRQEMDPFVKRQYKQQQAIRPEHKPYYDKQLGMIARDFSRWANASEEYGSPELIAPAAKAYRDFENQTGFSIPGVMESLKNAVRNQSEGNFEEAKRYFHDAEYYLDDFRKNKFSRT